MLEHAMSGASEALTLVAAMVLGYGLVYIIVAGAAFAFAMAYVGVRLGVTR